MNRKGSVLLVVVFALVGLIAGAVTAGLLLGRPSLPTGGIAGNTATIPFVFEDTLTLNGVTTLTANLVGTTGDFSGEFELSAVEEGSVTTLSPATNTTLTAAQVCDSNVLNIRHGILRATTTLPITTDITGDCLSTNGDAVELFIRNTSTTSELTVVAGDASTTLVGAGSASSTVDTVQAADGVVLRLIRLTSDTIFAIVTGFGDAD